ncbi:MAG TPA: YIP1 family protein [Bacteroidota bacterium]|nr:YIP1 family protein [Bacteroidota bacterium]
MIACSICHSENHHLAIVCTSCGSFLQTKIDNLDLFTTIGTIIENPRKAFHKIAIAQHKNYMVFLSAIFGIGLIFFIYWLINIGEYFDKLLNILASGFFTGPFVGIITVVFFSVILVIIARILKIRVKLRNTMAVIAYALIPIVLSVILVLPIEILTFGTFFFTKNPSPLLLKPASYIVLLGLDGMFIMWSFILLTIGAKVLFEANWQTVSFILITSLAITSTVTFWLLQFLFYRLI